MSTAADKPVRHILALSGGKDSSALAVFMKDKVPDMEYVFCDTEKELDETYEYMQRLSLMNASRPHFFDNAPSGSSAALFVV